MTHEIWTQRFDISWRPELRFFERGVQVLRNLEDGDVSSAFRVEPEQVSAQLGDANLEIFLKPTGLIVQARTPEVDMEKVQAACEMAISEIRPRNTLRFVVAIQHLAPIAGDYARVRRDAAQGFFGDWARGVDVTDCAILIDVDFDDAGMQLRSAEFGIVNEGEIPMRLERMGGRTGALAGRPDIGRWRSMDLPSVALFLDSTWQSTQPIQPDSVLDSGMKFWGRVITQADDLASRLEGAASTRTDEDPGGEVGK